MEPRINHGDVVRVSIVSADICLSNKARVIAIPVGPGDSWVFERLDLNDVIYVSEGCTIIKTHDRTDIT